MTRHDWVLVQMGGSGAIIDALMRGIKKHGGRVRLRAHVDQVRPTAHVVGMVEAAPMNMK
jgi:phytoene dehydrogenase-like protein